MKYSKLQYLTVFDTKNNFYFSIFNYFSNIHVHKLAHSNFFTFGTFKYFSILLSQIFATNYFYFNKYNIYVRIIKNYVNNNYIINNRLFLFTKKINSNTIQQNNQNIQDIIVSNNTRTLVLVKNDNPIVTAFNKWDLFDNKKLHYPKVFRKKALNILYYSYNSKQVSHETTMQILEREPRWQFDDSNIGTINSFFFCNSIFYSAIFYNAIYLNNPATSVVEFFCNWKLKKNLLSKFKRKRFKKKVSVFDSKKIYIASNKIAHRQIYKPLFLLNKNHTWMNAFLFFSNSSFFKLIQLFSNILYIKYLHFLLTNYFKSNQKFDYLITKTLAESTNFYFYETISCEKTNLISNKVFEHAIEIVFLRILTRVKYQTTTTPWDVTNLHRFISFCTGKKSLIKINGFIKNSLSIEEQTFCLKWSSKITKFRKKLGNFLFLNESLQLIYLSFKLKDPYLLSNWMTKIFQKISFWKSRLFLSYMKYVIRNFFYTKFSALKMHGVKFQLSGKISVAGNARTRTIRYKAGYTSQSKFDFRVLTVLNLIPSFTGVQGFKVWFYF